MNKDYLPQLKKHQEQFLGFRSEKDKAIIFGVFIILLFLGLLQ